MIEVEKKFLPSEEQMTALLEGAEFLGEEVLEDIYYDYPDYSLFKKYVYLRNRNGNFELKIGDDEISGISDEVEKEEDIKLYFKTSKSIPEFIAENFTTIIHWETRRKKYKKGKFIIDVDEIDFGYRCIEIELLVSKRSEVPEAKQKIIEFAEQNNLEIKDVPTKRGEYFHLVKPEVYKKLINK